MKPKAGNLSPHAFLKSHNCQDYSLQLVSRSTPSLAEAEDFVVSDPVRDRILQTSQRSGDLGFRGRVNGAVLTGQKYSRNFHAQAVGVDTMSSMDGMISKDVALSFHEWFRSQTHGLFDKIFQILQGFSNRQAYISFKWKK